MTLRKHSLTRLSCVILSLACALAVSCIRCVEAAVAHRPAAAGDYELHSALELSLFAKEPDVVDPVALTFDEQGRLYVVEMRDYPYGFGPERKPGGTIRLLEDTNADGRADRSVLFAEGLSFSTSIAPWRGGVLVTAPPEILFLKDTNDDGKADVREVMLKGFTLGVTDSNVNGLRWGLDNRVHAVNGGNGGEIISARKPGPAVPLRNMDFSFDPDTGDFTPTFHTSAGFGLVFDDWGRSFVTYNINHIQQRIIPIRYLNRFPGMLPVEATMSISDHEDMSRIYPISTPETRVNHPEQSGHFSSAGGMGIIGVPHFGPDLHGSVLVCDVIGNLVHRDVVGPHGPIFVARRAANEQRSEFFASRDGAFRPVGIELGPDGALYLIDMQRDVIEHPDYIPDKVKAKLDIRAGENRGRIYRITPKGGLPVMKPKLDQASAAELVRHLANPNQWWRSTAQRLLVERQDQRALPDLKALAVADNPLGRLHALWTLQGLSALPESLVARGLVDPHPGVRENALLLAESFVAGSTNLQEQILRLADDPDPRVRFQTALTLGQFEHAGTEAALQRILLKDYAERWSRLAVLSSLRIGEKKLFVSLLADSGFRSDSTQSRLELVRELADLHGARSAVKAGQSLSDFLAPLLNPATNEKLPVAAFNGLHSGLTRATSKPTIDASTKAMLEKLARTDSPEVLASAWKLSRLLDVPANDTQRAALARAMERIQDGSRTAEQRIEDIKVVALGEFSAVGASLLALLQGQQPSAIQFAVIEALRQFSDRGVATGLIERWRSLAPAMRSPVINLLLQRVAFQDVLLGALEQEKLRLGELNLDLEQRRRLLRESTSEIKARAERFLGDEEYSNRKTVVAEWLEKLPTTGDPLRGRVVFEKACAQCHLLDGAGSAFGPDLAALAHRSVEDLASNILDPNMAINPSYAGFTVETAAGETEAGILDSENPEAIVLLQALGRKTVVPRKEIKRLESTGVSLMPEGLEAGLTPMELRDVIALIQQRR